MSERDIQAVERLRRELPVARYRRGYRVADVDTFLEWAVASLRARLTENEGMRAGVALGSLWHGGTSSASGTAVDVAAQTFALARSSYRLQEVDDLLDEVTYLLAQLEAENDALRARSGSR